VSSSSNKQEFHMDCDVNGVKMAGTFRIEAADSENIKGSMEMNSTGNGRTMNSSYTFTSKWIGATCPAKDQN